MRWKRRKTWRELWEKPVVFLAEPSNDSQRTDNAEALVDLFDLMANVRMQPGIHLFIFDKGCRLHMIQRRGLDQT